MTLKDIFAHLISWRWQFAAWVAALTVGLIFDAVFGSFGTFRAYLVDAELGALVILLLVNVAWTLLKVCAAFPVIWDILFWSWWIDQ